DGPHSFRVRAKDPAGNVDASPAQASFTVDTGPPDTAISTGPSGLIANPTPQFEFSSTEAGSTFQCSLDSKTFASCSSPFTTDPLTDGAHTFEVRAVDAVSNVDSTPASRSFTVDTQSPD